MATPSCVNSIIETMSSKKRRLDEGPSAANNGVVTIGDVQRLIDQRVLQVEQATQLELASMRRQVDALEGANAALKKQVEELKLETEDLRRRCAVNTRAIQVLKKDVEWTYSAPNISLSHWVDQGHDDQYIAGMTKLVNDIKTATETLRNGKANPLTITLNAEVPLAHDDILLPHWSELSDAIQLLDMRGLLSFCLLNMQLDRSVQDMLSRSLALKCNCIGLSSNRFNGQDGIDFAVEVIQNNPQLHEFVFLNAIENEEYANRLCRSIIAHPKIQQLGLINICNEGDSLGYSMLKTFATSSTKSFSRLSLFGSHIRTNGCTALPDYIASNPPLVNLGLTRNHLVDDDLRMISIALKANDTLKEIHLDWNDYTSIGLKWLEVAVRGLKPIQTANNNSFLDPNFDSAFDCNHTCRIFGTPVRTLAISNRSSPHENKLRKLYGVFDLHSKRGDLVNELQRSVGGDLIALIPFVLQRVEAIHFTLRNSSVSSPMSILLGLLREMPDLLDN